MAATHTDIRPALVVHGGAAASIDAIDGCRRSAQRGLQQLSESNHSLEAVVAAVVELEDDGRFNAGSGVDVGLDGHTMVADAGVMDTRGRLGAVASLPALRNPVLVARAVSDTPHCLLAGAGALRFARLLKLDHPIRASQRAQKKHRDLLARLGQPGGSDEFPGFDNGVFQRLWNYELRWESALQEFGCGTVGAVARDAQGHFAVASSTGGSAPSLDGRVGDTPIIGCGFYAGPVGAVAVTGIGEFVVRKMMAHTVYDWLASGEKLQPALERAVGLMPSEVDFGIIGVTADETGAASNRTMPHAVAEDEKAKT